MTQNQPIDMSQDEYLRQRPRSVAEDLDDVTEPAFTNQPTIPKSAKIHAQKVEQGRAELAHERNMDQLAVAAGREADERAYEESLRRIAKGQDVSPKLAASALRHQRSLGGLGLSTAQLHAMGHRQSQPRPQPQDTDHRQRNRHGRREG